MSAYEFCPLCAEYVRAAKRFLDEGGRRWHRRCASRALAIMPGRVVGDRVEELRVRAAQ